MTTDPTDSPTLRPIARIHSPFPEKFGVPRQSGLVPGLRGIIAFEPGFQIPEALRGLDGFSHIWLLWGFTANAGQGWHPTVRPPRLGGNRRLGVFATRSPFRPNPIGLSCVELLRIIPTSEKGPLLEVGGADLIDNTPIYDIKPYLPYADCIPNASGGFAPEAPEESLSVDCPPELLHRIPEPDRKTFLAVLACDPRPAYRRTEEGAENPPRSHGIKWKNKNIRFRVENQVLTVLDIFPLSTGK